MRPIEIFLNLAVKRPGMARSDFHADFVQPQMVINLLEEEITAFI